jgi:vesicle-fusing ATPase
MFTQDRRLLVLATTSNEHFLREADLLSSFSTVIHVERLTQPKHVAAVLEDSNVFTPEECQYIEGKLHTGEYKIAVGIKRMLELIDFVKQGERDYQVNLLLDAFQNMEIGIENS